MPTLEDILNNNPNSVNINDLIVSIMKEDSTFSKELKDRFVKVADIVGKKLETEANKINFKNATIDLSSLMGQTPETTRSSKRKYQKIQKDILNNIQEVARTTKIDIKDPSLKLSSLFNVNPQIGMAVSMKFNRTRWLVLKNINEQLTKNKQDIRLGSTMFTLDKMFNVPVKMGLLTSLKFNKVRRQILSAISKGIPTDGLAPEGKISLDMLFGAQPQMGLITRLKFNSVRRKVLGKIKEAADSAEFTFTKEPITLDTFFSIPPKMGLWTRHRFEDMRRALIGKIKSAAKTTEFTFTKEPLTLDKLFGVTPRASLITKMLYQHTLRSVTNVLGKKLKDDIKNMDPVKDPEQATSMLERLGMGKKSLTKKIGKGFENIIGGIGKGIGTMVGAVKGAGSGKKPKSFFDKEESVTIAGFSKDALKQLEKLTGGKIGGTGTGDVEIDLMGLIKEAVGGLFKKIALIGLAGLAGVGLGALALKFQDFLETIPILNAVFKVPKAIGLMSGGDWKGGFKELGKIFWPGDDAESNALFKLVESLKKTKGGAKFVASFTDIHTKFTDFIEEIPYLNAFVKIPNALGLMSAGDWKGGLKELAEILPGVRIFNQFMASEKGQQTKEKVKDFMQPLVDFGKEVAKKIYNIMPDGLKTFFRIDKNGNIVPKSAKEMFQEFDKKVMPGGKKRALERERDDIIAKKNIAVKRMYGAGMEENNPELFAKYKKYVDRLDNRREEIGKKLESMEDFIWRPGSEPRKFSKDDTLIGAKEGISLKEGKDIHMGIQEMKNVLEQMNTSLNSLVGLTDQSIQVAAQAAEPKQAGSGLDNIPQNAGTSREPAIDKAYSFRTRAWEILHGVT